MIYKYVITVSFFFFLRERDSTNRVGAETEGESQSYIDFALNAEPTAELEPVNGEIIT